EPVDAGASTQMAEVQVSASGGTQHTATVVRKGVDADGVTLWELEESSEIDDTIAAVPSAMKGGRATGSVRSLTGNTPAGEAEPAAAGAPASPAAAVPAGRSRAGIVAAVLLLGAGGAGGWYLYGRNRDHGDAPAPPPLAAATIDAGMVHPPAPADAAVPAPAEPAVLVIDSQPQGARVLVDGNLLSATTPTEIEVAPGVPHAIAIEKDGFTPWKLGGIVVAAGDRPRFAPELTALSPRRAALHVTSTPPGAQVKLGNRILGETPLDKEDLEPGRYELTLTRVGYQPQRAHVVLEPGRTARLDRTLEEAVKEGTVFIGMPPSSWANVFLNGRQVGTVPRQTLRLPVGHHRLHLENPQTGKQTNIDVDVVEGKRTDYKVTDW
ncbi:MAG TPA: PEGA domain-containing protein, partial [Kofleriaceae bacterium]|nr:PEGA domain-containing protein [Kofleriaceae bacterium]